MRPLRGAIVGFGNVAARGHWPALAATPDLDIVAVVDRSDERRAEARRVLSGRVEVFASIEELAASAEEIDFVDIATPPSSHVPLARFALARGWHVACEKPLTLDPAEFAGLAADARRADRTLFTMHNWKVAPILAAAFGALDEGRLGCVRHVDVLVFRNQPCSGVSSGEAPVTPGAAVSGSGVALAVAGDRVRPGNWREDPAIAGGGILVDHGWHNFYLLLRLAGEEPLAISAEITHPLDDPDLLDDSARVVVTFPQADAFLHLTWRAAARRNAIFVHGDRGSLVLDDDRLVICTRDAAPEIIRFEAGLSAGSHHEDWFRMLLPEFVAEVRDRAVRGRNLREAGWCVVLTQAAYRSGAQGGRLVQVSRPEMMVEE